MPIEKCGRTVFEIVLFIDDIETIKKGLLQLPACYNNLPVYSFLQVDFNNKLYISLFEKYELSFVDEVFHICYISWKCLSMVVKA